MKTWVDCEFIDDGRTIELISLGAVREDEATFYAEVQGVDLTRANQWVTEHVLPHLTGPQIDRQNLAEIFKTFVGDHPEFWGWFPSYDWVAICQLYGPMVNLPSGWPMRINDIQQTADTYGVDLNEIEPEGDAHNALGGALWHRAAHRWVGWKAGIDV